jgi:hypothetical protein
MIESRESLKTMGNWKRRTISKKTKGSQSTGRSKGIISSPLERTLCRRNRSWKNPLYTRVMSKLTGEKRMNKKG